MKQSRFLIYLFCTLFIVAFISSSCGDDEPGEETTNDLIGVWSLNSVTYSNCSDPSDNGTEDNSCTATDCIKWEFRTGGVLIATDLFDGDTDTETGSYTISGSNLTVTIEGEMAVGTYSVNGTQFVYNFQDPELDCNTRGTFTRD